MLLKEIINEKTIIVIIVLLLLLILVARGGIADTPSDLEIVGDCKVQRDSYSFYIIGTIKNNFDESYDYVEVTFNLYDKDGNQLDIAMDNTNNLKGGGTWKFKAMAFTTDVKDIKSYELSDIDAFKKRFF